MTDFIKRYTGNIFDSNADVIAHGVNTQGLMGGGIAKEVKARFPNVDEEYRLKVGSDTGFITGTSQLVPIGEGKYVANVASQDLPGPHADYEMLKHALYDLYACVGVLGLKTIALPQIGCGIGGLDWKIVKARIEIIALHFNMDYGVNTELWTFDS